MASASALQAEDVGSIPIIRSKYRLILIGIVPIKKCSLYVSVLLSSCVIQLASMRGPGSVCSIAGDTVKKSSGGDSPASLIAFRGS